MARPRTRNPGVKWSQPPITITAAEATEAWVKQRMNPSVLLPDCDDTRRLMLYESQQNEGAS